MILRLKRFSYAPTETEGTLTLADGTTFATIEQPWVPNPNGAPGGKPFESCVPDGMYTLLPWTRPSGAEVFIMFNPQLGVHKLPEHHAPGVGRDLCLLHLANFVTDIEGCIGPGVARALLNNPKTGRVERGVASSGVAMSRLNAILGRTGQHILSIEAVTGASNGK